MAKPENKREEEFRAATCETEKRYRMKFHRLINFIINLDSKLMNDGKIYIYIKLQHELITLFNNRKLVC